MMKQMKAIWLNEVGQELVERVYDGTIRQQLHSRVALFPQILSSLTDVRWLEQLRDAQIIFTTWGMPVLTEDQIRHYLPNLQIIFYAAGSVQSFARPFLAAGVRIVSAWQANAVPVAEYTAAQIVLAHKGFFQSMRLCKSDYQRARAFSEQQPGNYQARVGILGAGMIGKLVIEQLKSLMVEVVVFDPFLSEAQAANLGVVKLELSALFASCDTISNHLANLPETVGMLNIGHFEVMKPFATFINTGRGAQVKEADLIRALRDVPTRTAVLDVTDPEPPEVDSELLTLDNVILTPHLAGSMNREVARMGAYMAEECDRYLNGEPLLYEVTYEMLATMA